MAKDIAKTDKIPDVASLPNLKSVSDVITGGPFHPELPRLGLSTIQDIPFILHDVAILENMETDFGTHDSALFLVEDVDNHEQYTTICSGVVVVKQARQLVDLKPYPIKVTFTRPGRYWMMV